MARRARYYRRQVGVDFFRLESATDFADALDSVVARHPQVVDRNLEVGDGYARVYGWARDAVHSRGVLLRLRTSNAPSIARLDDDVLEDLELQANEAVAEYFCFGYFPQHQVLAVHRNRDAGRQARLLFYVERMSGGTPIHATVLLSTDAFDRLRRMYAVTVADLKLAMPMNLQVHQTGNVSVQDLIKIAHESGAASVTVHLSMERTKRTLSDRVKDALTAAVGDFPGAVEKATLRGRLEDDPDEIVVVDLISDRMAEVVDVEGQDGRITIDGIHQAIREAYDRRADEILEQFPPELTL